MILKTVSDNDKYYKMPFLYLIASYSRNQAINWADKKYRYIEKRKTGSWMVYKFEMR